ncbi:MAG: DUF3810 domain-containing protein [Clostridia bacterium]|nr:DUF3810 domain-containing protein [Clostridia bacterium]
MRAFCGVFRRYALRIAPLLLFPLALVLDTLSRAHPQLTESLYSRRIYPLISRAGSLVTAFTPVCMAELMLCAAVLAALGGLVALVTHRNAVTRRRVASFVLTVLAAASACYFFFVVLWGLNYNRQPLAQNLGYKGGSVTSAELSATLTREVNAINSLLADGRIRFDAKGRSFYTGGLLNMEQQTIDGFNTLARQNSLFNRNYVCPKGVLLSLPWCYTGVEGIFIPFTFEPCVNTVTPAFMLPFNMSHETAHFKGFAKEDEANYVAYLAATANSDPYFRYSGHMAACSYLSNALYATDQALWQQSMSKLDSRAVGDFNYYNQYVERFAGPVQKASQQMNDSYLKSQGEPQGIVSYNLFVSLLAAEYRTNGG